MAIEHSNSSGEERLILKEKTASLYSGAWMAGGVGIVAAMVFGYMADHSLKRFFFAYLVSFMYFLSLSLGGLFFVILQHVTKAGWSVNVRRIAEWLAASMPMMAILATPIVIPVLLHRADLYPWAAAGTVEPVAEVASAAPPEEQRVSESAKASEARAAAGEEEMTPFKRFYLNPMFWALRIVVYFMVWSVLGIWYWKQSLNQDKDGDIEWTVKMQAFSPVAMILFGVTLTGAAFDLLMSLDPNWSSTIFGVYYFAGCVIAIFSTIILAAFLLQRAGYMRESVTIEHFHDLGKFLFGFVFFWGYIAFSQYMLQWYANLPEETIWFRHHGATTAAGSTNTWTRVVVILLFGHLLIPFAGLVSRHVKRNPATLVFWAVWMLIFHWVDLFWLVMPQLDYQFHFGLVEVATFVGIGGLFLAFMLSRAAQGAIRPMHDPRLEASLEFQNI